MRDFTAFAICVPPHCPARGRYQTSPKSALRILLLFSRWARDWNGHAAHEPQILLPLVNVTRKLPATSPDTTGVCASSWFGVLSAKTMSRSRGNFARFAELAL